MEDFLKVLLGDLSFGSFAGYLTLTLIGALVSLFFDVKNRDGKSGATPKKFSISFLMWDNVKRFIGVIILLYVVVRFSDKLFPGEPIDWVMVSIGFNIDAVIASIKKDTKLLSMNREKFSK